MKKSKISFICSLFVLTSYGQFNMPSFKEVVNKFFSGYSFESYENYLKFQRKRDGWYISQDSFTNPGHSFNEVQFWSKQCQCYVDIDYPFSNGDTLLIADQVNTYMKTVDWNYEESQFRVNKYYGYPGWAWDVIQDSSDLQSDVDSLLESQARAYSNYASGFITEQYGDLFVNSDTDRVALKATDPVSKTRINKFIFYDLRSVDAYKKLMRINPAYETRVGDVRTKCANEYIFMYCELMMAGDSLQAKKFAGQADYPDSLLQVARNYLHSVPMNSILITGGDNDTYPLWYVQEVEQYRPDVIVLNYSLLGLRRFLSMVDRQYRHTLFATRDTTYLKDNFDYSLYGNNGEDSVVMSVDNFLRDLNRNYNPYDTSVYYYKNESIKKYYSKKIFFAKSKLKPARIVNLKHYLMMNDYILLDIINTSLSRNVYFTFEVELLKDVLDLKDKVYKLVL